MAENTDASGTTAVKEQVTTKAPMETLRASLTERQPLTNPLEAQNLDQLVVSQISENINRYGAKDFLIEDSQGNSVYSLPCEFRKIDGEYYFFVPRVANWHFRRALPVHGNHPPLAETYTPLYHQATGKIDFGHDFERKFAQLNHIPAAVELGRYFETDSPCLIGGQDEPTHTPYHLFFWTNKGAVIELQSPPTLFQRERLTVMAQRFTENTGIPMKLRQKGKKEPLASPQEALPGVEIKVSLAFEYPYVRTNSHQIALTENNQLEVYTMPRPKNSPMVYGFGYNLYELQNPDSKEEYPTFTIFFDPGAKNHNEAMAGFVIDKISSRRWSAMHEKDRQSVKDISSIDIHRQIEESLPDFEKVTLPDKWTYPKEAIENPLPYTLRVAGFEIKVGLRAMINIESGEATLDLLADERVKQDDIQKQLLSLVAEKFRKNFAGNCEYIYPGDLQGPQMKEIKKVTANVIFTKANP